MLWPCLLVLCILQLIHLPPAQGQGDVLPWQGDGTVRSLHREYSNIFKHGNRNAASHLWSSFLLDRSHFMTQETLELMFSGFCAVSGSPVQPSDFKRYGLNLESVTGHRVFGYMYYCCWPCVCDTQDFIKVDTKNVTMVGGEEKQFHFAVIGNPCDDEEALHRPFFQPFYGGRDTTLFKEAPEVRCNPDGTLIGATLSDHGYPIISMIFDAQLGPNVPATINDGSEASEGEMTSTDQVLESTREVALPGLEEQPGRLLTHPLTGVRFHSEHEYATMCSNRAANGYNSGMGEIFRRAASISPIRVNTRPVLPPPPSSSNIAPQVVLHSLPEQPAVEDAGAKSEKGPTDLGNAQDTNATPSSPSERVQVQDPKIAESKPPLSGSGVPPSAKSEL